MAPKLIVIGGPTASGKTGLGVLLAKRVGGEVISADSMQIYRGMEIGTAAPTEDEMQGVPHHMLGVLSPEEACSAARYAEMASECVEDVLRRGRVPVIVGGTGLYINALLKGQEFSPQSERRPELQRRAAEEGIGVLLEELRRVDPESAARLHPNDEKRILRALEVWYETGKTITQFNLESRSIPPRYEAVTFVLTFRDRQMLYDRVNRRVGIMFAEGLANEVRALLARGVPPESTAMQAIGYREAVQAVAMGGAPEDAAELIRQNSRRYAKRQLTWFRRTEGAHWLLRENGDDLPAMAAQAEDILRAEGFSF